MRGAEKVGNEYMGETSWLNKATQVFECAVLMNVRTLTKSPQCCDLLRE